MNPSIEHFNERATHITQMIKQAQRLHASKHTSAEPELQDTLKTIRILLFELQAFVVDVDLPVAMDSILKALWTRYQRLSPYPPQEIVTWAQTALKLPLCIVGGDSVYNQEDQRPELTRFVIMNRDASFLFDESLALHPETIPQTWQKLLMALEGQYILAHDLLLAQVQISTTADYYHLDTPVLIGSSFQSIYDLCFGMAWQENGDMDGSDGVYPRLPLPTTTAIDSVKGMLHLLRSLAQGTYCIE